MKAKKKRGQPKKDPTKVVGFRVKIAKMKDFKKEVQPIHAKYANS